MEQSIERSLEFNDRQVYFLPADGMWWIAIKPICEALGVDYEAQRKRLTTDPILSKVWAAHTIMIMGKPTGPAKGSAPSVETVQTLQMQGRKMVCLPEFFVYGWIFKLKSGSKQLEAYQWQCYQLLYNYFHGTLNQRNAVLREHQGAIQEARHLEQELAAAEPRFAKLRELRNKVRGCNKTLRKLDGDLVSNQLPIWSAPAH